jgi:hypothetical protein
MWHLSFAISSFLVPLEVVALDMSFAILKEIYCIQDRGNTVQSADLKTFFFMSCSSCSRFSLSSLCSACSCKEEIYYLTVTVLCISVVDPDPETYPVRSETFSRIRIRKQSIRIQIRAAPE